MASSAPQVLWLPRGRPASIRLAVDDTRLEYARLFASNLVFLRAQAGIPNQPKLAELVGVSGSTVQRWESGGGVLPDAWELRRLADVLQVDLETLVEPEPMTERERVLAKRAARAVRRGLGRARQG